MNLFVIKEKKIINILGITDGTTIDPIKNVVFSFELGGRYISQQKSAEPAASFNLKQKGEIIRVAVMDFKANGISQLLASNISELVRNELIMMGGFAVLERSQVDQILKEQGFQQTGCTDTTCAVKVGQLLSAKKILIGTVMKMGNKILISGRIVDVEKGLGEIAANESAISADELDTATSKFAKKLAGY
jgi:curli biogenesis system outer membrane secretion channel CsgG